MSNKKNILFDVERMKYPNTGLHHFCLNLGQSLLDNLQEDEQIKFLLPSKAFSCFPANIDYIHLRKWHKFMLPQVNNFDIWHTTYQTSAYFPFNTKASVVFTIHDLNYLHDESKSAEKKKKFIAKLQKKIDRSQHIVCISNFTLDDCKQHLDLGNKPLSVIYNGCNINNSNTLFAPLNKPKCPFLFSIGTIVEKKNFHVLPALLVNNNYHLFIGGITQSEHYKQRIIDEAIKYDVQDRLFFTGALSENDKCWFLNNCEAFVFPSIAEGFGLPVVEAMYFGKPIFLSNLTSLPEIGSNAAYYFSSFEPLSMQRTLTEGLNDYKNDQSKKASIIKRAAIFSWQKAATEYLNIYRSLY